jgi:CHAD domain-containing protein
VLEWRSLDGALLRRSRAAKLPEFGRDLAETPHADLAAVVEPRRLLPLVHEELQGESRAVLDERDKTVARVHLERGAATAPARGSKPSPLGERLRVSEVRGYPAPHQAVVEALDLREGLRRLARPAIDLALDAAGLRAGSYSSKLDLTLDGSSRADDAARAILRALLAALRANEDGTRRDLDSEFLHDFRVAVRRTRSCLGQLDGVFGEAATRRFRDEFKWLGGISGPTRDLDVYLLKMPEYVLEVPESLRAHLAPLERYLRERHGAEQRKVARALGSKRYRALVADWEAFLEAPAEQGPDAPANAARPIVEVASERIRRAYRKVRRHGREIDAATPRPRIHRLRIDCKKLRYLLEFFRSLYDGEAVANLVRVLKQLQDVLGDFNDVANQQGDLCAMAREIHEREPGAVDTLLAMGCLLGRLGDRERALREGLSRSAQEFGGDEVGESMSRLTG